MPAALPVCALVLQLLSSSGASFARVVEELILDPDHPLPATLTDPTAKTADSQQQQHQQERLWATDANGPAVSFVIQLFEQVASILLDASLKVGPRL